VALLKLLPHLLAAVDELSCPDHLAGGIVDDGEPGSLAAGIDFEAKWWHDGSRWLP
jgi:hypothetical protein